jgi:molybdate transport system ATP-binding protein
MEGRLTLSDSLKQDLLTVRIEHRVGTVSLDVRFALTEPWTVLFGPSGSGKTTVLRAIAGFVRPDEGLIVQGKTVLLDSATHVFVPAYQRRIRSAGQAARLFPHMSVRSNAMYGNGWRSKPAEARTVVEAVMRLFGLTKLADRMPPALSGGEKQRASVARAVVSAITFEGPGAALLLLDEPFSGLDNAMRDDLLVALRDYLRRWKTPVLSVTHDIGEAFQLGAEVIKIADGRVVLQGPAATVLAGDRERLLDQLNASKKSPA